eukprot:COSAG01_NODE_5147_length_4453_cov_8.549209_1_plen_76_part_00
MSRLTEIPLCSYIVCTWMIMLWWWLGGDRELVGVCDLLHLRVHEWDLSDSTGRTFSADPVELAMGNDACYVGERD